MAYDPDLDLLYIGVGTGSPWNHMRRSGGKGDNLFLASIVAVKPDNGQYVWHYQTTPGESWDYTATQHIMLADLTIGGQLRKVLIQAPKNGFFYVLDRATGSLISAKPYTTINWATGIGADGRPIEAPGVRYEKTPTLVFPGPQGGHGWHPMAFDPAEGLVYIPAMDVPFVYGDDGNFAIREGGWNVGVNYNLNGLPDEAAKRAAIKAVLKGKLVAWDPAKQEARWTVDHPSFWNAGILATAGGLVFQGTAEGQFAAYLAKDGTKVWSYEAGNGIIAAPATYSLDGEQYVAVMVGYGGAMVLVASWAFAGAASAPGASPSVQARRDRDRRAVSETGPGDDRLDRRDLDRRCRGRNDPVQHELPGLPERQRQRSLPARLEDLADDPVSSGLQIGRHRRRPDRQGNDQFLQLHDGRTGRVGPRVHPVRSAEDSGRGGEQTGDG